MKHLHEKLLLLGYRQHDDNVFISEFQSRWTRISYFISILKKDDVWELHISASVPVTIMYRKVIITAAGEVFYYAWQFQKLVTHQQLDTMIMELLKRYPDGNSDCTG